MLVTGADARSVDIAYDGNNRLTIETSTGADITDEYQYGYDPNGNQLTKIKSSIVATTNAGTPSIGMYQIGDPLANGDSDAEVSVYDVFNRLVQTKKGWRQCARYWETTQATTQKACDKVK